jgi:tetratricopeptide (TPR) repeat protein
MRAWVFLLFWMLAFVQAPAAAETRTPAPRTSGAIAKAKRHFERALDAYREGSYRTAITELERALELDPEGKDLVYNLGLVYEKLGEVDQAIAQFERYLGMETDPREGQRARLIIRRLEGARAEIARKQAVEQAPHEAAAPTAAPPGPPVRARPSQPERQPGRLDAWVVTAAGAAVAATIVGTVFGLRALAVRPSAHDSTGAGTSAAELQQRAEDAHDLAVVADVAFAIALSSAGVGAALYFLRDAQPDAAARARGLGAKFEVHF